MFESIAKKFQKFKVVTKIRTTKLVNYLVKERTNFITQD